MRVLVAALLLFCSGAASATNEFQAWKGAVEPAESSPSGNEYQGYKGAVEPAESGGGGGTIVPIILQAIGHQ